jgi:ribosomal protein L7/L12
MELKYIIIGTVIVVVIILALKNGGNSVSDLPPEGTTDENIRDLAQTRKIQAIKWYRAIHGVGLKEAKDAVEKLMKE